MPFESDLELRHRPGHTRWEVIRVLQYRTKDGRLITVPVGYLSDLASVPHLARRIVDPQTPAARRPSVVHDRIYTHETHRFTKAEADRIFYDALREEGMNTALAWLMYQAVRIGGRGTWSA
ncbi:MULTISPECIES: DUF1353 domain-containing protein [Pseudomonas]|uniref:DUF1353 domain-containing protein n=1 Tax=Pseudomonas TaxID=286 RepID=UPI000F478B6F|nr:MULTISPECIES: DUF1353 domain-containing protein [Pseudomonas]MDP9525356.1 DUF1353 domain-containing protein [Pseudomonas protegens]NBF13168.1 DUF1353 domain-containing protein [Pseudomonas sp. Fl4BN1]ROM40634.1 hypothetical protein BK647_17950 [Pseudomonas protegens]